jgi:hypothetical protein
MLKVKMIFEFLCTLDTYFFAEFKAIEGVLL